MKQSRVENNLEEIIPGTVIVGVDIAKEVHWARCIDNRGIEMGKAISFKNDRAGYESMIAKIEGLCNNVLREPIKKIIIGLEPTGHYWKGYAHYMMQAGYRVVCINPYHTKKAKELDDNSPTANDKKDAMVIARLVKEGRYFEPYLPEGVYGELRVLTNARESEMKRNNAVKNTMTAILDEYFPEIWKVFKNPLTGKASRQILRNCPFPAYITELGADGVLLEIKKAVKKSVGKKKVQEIMKAAEETIGVEYGMESAKLRLWMLLEELELIETHLTRIEATMEQMLLMTGYSEQLLSIKGIGVVTAASFLGEVGDPLRFSDARQIANYAGYNLTEDSSGKSKSGTCISKRGRSQLRSLLYRMAITMVAVNGEMKALYQHMLTRKDNPLKKKQALVVISKKIITVIYSLLKKQALYDPALVLGAVRREKMAA